MIRVDVNMLNEKERALLDGSFQPALSRRRIRGALLSLAATLIAVLAFAQNGLTAAWFAAVACAVLVVAGIEKLVYQREMANYETLIRKLVNRVEELEGVPYTPEEGVPSRSVRESTTQRRAS